MALFNYFWHIIFTACHVRGVNDYVASHRERFKCPIDTRSQANDAQCVFGA